MPGSCDAIIKAPSQMNALIIAQED